MAEKANLKLDNIHSSSVKGIGATRVAIQTAFTRCVLKSIVSRFSTAIDIQCLEKIGGDIAPLNISEENIPSAYKRSLTEKLPRNVYSPIELLVGLDLMGALLVGCENIEGKLIIWNTKLGSAISEHFPSVNANANISENPTLVTNSEKNECENVELCNALKSFWEWEHLGIKEEKHVRLTQDELYADKHYTDNLKYNGKNYTVSLPFSPHKPKPNNNYQKALSHFLNLEKELLEDSERCNRYVEAIQKYIENGHVEEVFTLTPKDDIAYLMPHRDVYREGHESTKTRIVFNASSKAPNKISLNDALLPGVRLQPDLAEVLVGFREKKIALTGDISAMFLNIGLKKEDRNFVRFLWREPGCKGKIRVFRFKVLPFGLNCSPYLAIKTVKHHLSKIGTVHSRTLNEVDKQTYVDDYCGSSNSVAEAIKLRQDITRIMDMGGFHFQKWLSNSPEVMGSIPEVDRAAASMLVLAEKNIDVSPTAIASALGLVWNPVKDVFEFQGALELSLPSNKVETMRSLCSRAAKVFDPLGFLSPFLIIAKMLMQQCWKAKLKWDDPLPQDIKECWDRWIEEITYLHYIEIPRALCPHEFYDVQLHGFSDASERACAAVVYGRFERKDGKVTIRLIMAKAKVAPIKATTIPRLELIGALLAARISDKVRETLKLEKEKVMLWCDSTTALQWIREAPSAWKTYVGNRVSQIHEHFGKESWRYVPTDENPADVATRGIFAQELSQSSSWFTGPAFLEESTKIWPENIVVKKLTAEAKLEEKVHIPFSLITQSSEVLEQIFLNDRSFWFNLRVLAQIYRFAAKTGKYDYFDISSPFITLREQDHVMDCWVRNVQADGFPNALECLKKKGTLTDKALLQLQPFIDEDSEIIKVGGRLHVAVLPDESKHPPILPAKNKFVERYVLALHKAHCHAGPSTLLSILRTQFWLMKSRSEVKRIIRQCNCYRFRAKPFEQRVAPLPEERVRPAPSFLYVGMDYAGPFECFEKRGRRTISFKVWALIFTCCTSRACHIEVVRRMNADACVNAIQRVISRRGLMRVIFCDNFSTFSNVNKEIKKLYENLDWRRVRTLFMEIPQPIEFRFQAPLAPWWGGHFERHVQSLKKVLRVTLGNQRVGFDEMLTLMTQAEGMINSRPLTAVSQDPRDPLPITPAHLTIARGIRQVPDNLTRDDLEDDTAVLWHRRQRLHTQLWARWVKEYLLHLQPFSKWLSDGREPKVGETVLIGDVHKSRLDWPLATVKELHPSHRDGRTRMVTLERYEPYKKKLVTLRRDIRHIYKLEDSPSA